MAINLTSCSCTYTAPDDFLGAEGDPRLLWKYSFTPIWDLSTLQMNITAPLYSESVVYAAFNREMVCLDALDGELIWSRELGNPTAFNVDQVVEDEQSVYVAAGPKVYSVDKSSGNLNWETTLNTRSERGAFQISMVRANDLLVYGDVDFFFLLDSATGSLVEEIDLLEVRQTGGAVPGHPDVDPDNNLIYLPFGYGAENAKRGGVLCYDASSPSLLWDYQIPPLYLGASTARREEDTYANSVVFEAEQLYISAGRLLFRYDTEEQETIWADTLHNSIYWVVSGVSIDDTHTYTATNTGVFLAHNKEIGNRIWEELPLSATFSGRMEVDANELYMFLGGDVFILDVSSGETIWMGRPSAFNDVDKDLGFYSKVSLTDTTFAVLGEDGIYCIYRPGFAPGEE